MFEIIYRHTHVEYEPNRDLIVPNSRYWPKGTTPKLKVKPFTKRMNAITRERKV